MARRRRKRRKYDQINIVESNDSDEEKFIHHPMYGDIPLVRQTFPVSKEIEGKTGFSRVEKSYWLRPDPNYKPELPSGAVRGDVHKQDFCGWCHIPKYYYVDEQKQCIQCGEGFVFSAHEQKYWYETLKYNSLSTAIRCKKCRKQKRNDRALQHQQTSAVDLAKEKPNDPLAIMELAKSTYQYYERFNTGNIDLAISKLRKVRKIDPSRLEGKYWEARLQHIRGNEAKAKELMEEFLDEAEGKGKYASLIREVEKGNFVRSE